ncbi:metallo-beta-lactamase family protein RNase [Candidatus Vecturithrix granuli]|uniref:Metallo-beta-lactamase family protein RNase n=1 Tax=Vecturithrix granuli TaxID=1499967 RepID=A0A081BX54_VECG1|nr:metallo-beta-lactamase family protein RNase [Candidatus Vecturithrix granuli]
MSQTIVHLGAEHCVTGSAHLLQVNGLNILIDCGSIQGDDQAVPIEDWPVSPADIDYVFLTHAHIDHIGRLPQLIWKGFKGEILCTHATKALMDYMLEDALRFSDFSEEQCIQILQTLENLARGCEYQQPYDLKADIRFMFGQTGHILGSCFIRFEWDQPAFSVVFSGDVGVSHTPLLPDPAIPAPCDLLVMESTYGDRCHEQRQERVKRLGEALTRALNDKGKVLIPAFSLGRTQEILYEIDRLFSDPKWQQQFPELSGPHALIPVFIDSPLGEKLTTIYSRLSQFWDAEARALLHSGDHPLNFERLQIVKSYQEHQELLRMSDPAIIIAGSGMCTGGRIIDHLVQGLEDPRTDVFFVGYQAQGTPGRNILYYSQKPDGYVWLDRQKVFIRAKIHELSGYSAHADQQDLLNWVKAIPEKPQIIKLVHGEPEAQETLRSRLQQQGYHAV